MPKQPRKPAAPKKKPAADTVPVDALTHVADKRPNIPTRELAGFARDEPARKVLYPRDPSLDPQLVWKGKDEQDARPLEAARHPQEHRQQPGHPRGHDPRADRRRHPQARRHGDAL